MIKKLSLLLSIFLLTGMVGMAALLQIPPSTEHVQEPPIVLESLNNPNQGQANLISIQPYLTALDYASAGRLEQ